MSDERRENTSIQTALLMGLKSSVDALGVSMGELKGEMKSYGELKIKVDVLGNCIVRLEGEDKGIQGQIQAANGRIDKIEANTAWLWRTVGAAAIVLVVNMLPRIMALVGGAK